jgi:hypothetical protein
MHLNPLSHVVPTRKTGTEPFRHGTTVLTVSDHAREKWVTAMTANSFRVGNTEDH